MKKGRLMGDRAYTRFTIPDSALSTSEHRRIVAKIFGHSDDEFAALLVGPALPEPCDYYTGEALRQVGKAACLVIEDEEWNYGGSREMAELAQENIPFLQCNAAGGD